MYARSNYVVIGLLLFLAWPMILRADVAGCKTEDIEGKVALRRRPINSYAEENGIASREHVLYAKNQGKNPRPLLPLLKSP